MFSALSAMTLGIVVFAVLAVVGEAKALCPSEKQFSDALPEFRLISLRGQDRSVNELENSYALTTDKGISFYEMDIQSGLCL